MDNSEEVDGDQVKMLNGRYIMNALSFLNYEATENELLRHISVTGQPQNLDSEELKRILDYGVINGFIIKNDNKYSLPNLDDVHQIDGSESSSSNESGIGTPNEAENCPGQELISESKIVKIVEVNNNLTYTTEDSKQNTFNVTVTSAFMEHIKNGLCWQ